MRGRLVWALCALGVAALAAFAAPAASSAAVCIQSNMAGAATCGPGPAANRSVADDPSFKGWGYVSPCVAVCRTVDAWKWTGSSWTYSALYNSEKVYIYPFASGWSWAWSSGQGWRATHSSNLFEGTEPICPRLCIL
jgi:hypothetical protein